MARKHPTMVLETRTATAVPHAFETDQQKFMKHLRRLKEIGSYTDEWHRNWCRGRFQPRLKSGFLAGCSGWFRTHSGRPAPRPEPGPSFRLPSSVKSSASRKRGRRKLGSRSGLTESPSQPLDPTGILAAQGHGFRRHADGLDPWGGRVSEQGAERDRAFPLAFQRTTSSRVRSVASRYE